MKTKYTSYILILSLAAFLLTGLPAQAQMQLFGVAAYGGANNAGTIVKMNPDGSGLKMVYDFVDSTGGTPAGNLLQAKNGKLYGIGMTGGDSGSCVIYSLDPVTNTYEDLFNFGSVIGDEPLSGLIEGPDGLLYGVGAAGGSYGYGVIYSLNTGTNEYKDVYNFDGTSGTYPAGSLLLADDGKLYGMTTSDMNIMAGGIYSFDLATGTYTDLHDFAGINDGGGWGSLTEVNGKLYGMTSGMAYPYYYYDSIYSTYYAVIPGNYGNIFSYDLSTNLYADLYHFDSINGAAPFGSLVANANGLLFGMTSAGGEDNLGVIFSFDPNSNTYKDLLDFNGINGADPMGDLSISTDGNFYGSTYLGGANYMGTFFQFNFYGNSLITIAGLDSALGYSPMFGGFKLAQEGAATAIATPPANETFSAYPVPTNRFITLNVQVANASRVVFTLTDVSGRPLLKIEADAVNGQLETNIDLNTLSSGIYLLNADINGSKLVRKIVKE